MARTILQIAQDAAPKMGVDVPDALVGSTDETEVEILSLAQELAERIARAHDWSLLKTLVTHAGNGSQTGFDLPSDYLRMPKEGQVWSTRWQRPLLHISPEEALRLDIRNYDLVTGTWTIIGGQVVYAPALDSGESAKFYYISNAVVAPSTGSNKARFTADTDTFRLGDRLMELHLIAEWRNRKGLDYGEDMVNADTALSQAISDDRGARIVTQMSRRNVRANIAWPWEITP